MLSVEELVDRLIDLSFAEDIGDGDHTTLCCIPEDAMGKSHLLIKEDGILAGVEIAKEVFRRTGYMLGIGLANYASIVDPEAIILTGGISHAGKWIVDPCYESFESHVFGNLKGKVRILMSKLDDRERDVLGASALAWSVPEYSLFK